MAWLGLEIGSVLQLFRATVKLMATFQGGYQSTRHTVMSSHGQRVTGQLVTNAFCSQSQLVTRSSHHTVISSQAAI